MNEALSLQIRRHYREVREFRIILHNFTGIVQNVLMDMLNQVGWVFVILRIGVNNFPFH